MPGHTPRFTGTYWVGHGALMARIANLLWLGDVVGAAKVVSDNPTDFADLATAFKKNLNDAGYNDDGTPNTPPIDPSAASAPFHRKFIASQSAYCERVNGPCRVSVAVIDGNQVGIGYSANRDEWIEGQAGFANGGYEVHVPAGAWWMNVKMGLGMPDKDAEVSGFPVT